MASSRFLPQRLKRVLSKPGHHRSVALINDPVNTSQTFPVGQELKYASVVRGVRRLPRTRSGTLTVSELTRHAGYLTF